MTGGRLDVLVHELRSPVAALVAIADAYADADSPTRPRLLELARQAGASIGRLLTDLNEATLRLTRVDLGRIALDSCDTATLGGSTVVVVPEIDASPEVIGDATRLRQALDNLIGNAIGHSPAGATVTVRLERSGSSCLVSVSDQGQGILPEDLERIFEPGVRVTSIRPGSGLGLAVVREIAREHGGEVEVESRPGQGSTFRLVLPVASDVL